MQYLNLLNGYAQELVAKSGQKVIYLTLQFVKLINDEVNHKTNALVFV